MFKTEDRILAVFNWIHIVLLTSSVFVAIGSLIRVVTATYPPESGTAAVVSVFDFEHFALGGVFLFLPLIVSYFALRKVESLPLYALLAAGVSALLWFTSRNPLTAFLSLAIFYVRGSTRMKRAQILADLPAIADRRGEDVKLELWEIPTILDSPSMPQLILHVVCYFVILFLGDLRDLKIVFFLMLADAFAVLILVSTGNMKGFLIRMRGIANIPFQTMKQVQRAVMGVLLAAMALCVLPAVIFGREPLTFLRDIRFQLGLGEQQLQTEEMTFMDADPFGEFLPLVAGEGGGEMPRWLNVGLQIFLYVACAYLLYLLVRLIIRSAGDMMKSYRAGGEMDEIEFLSPADGDEVSGLGSRISRSEARTPAGKIRKAYRKKIRKRYRGMFEGHETPSEIESIAGLAESREEIHELYEKARYGHLGCSKEDLERFMEL